MTTKSAKGNVGEGEKGTKTFKWTLKAVYSEIQDTQLDILHQDVQVHQPSALSDLSGGSTSMDVDVDIVEAELNAYTRVQQVSLDTDPLMWWKQHVQEFPRLARVARQYLAVPTTSASPERLFSSVGLVRRLAG
jgi:hypothetical protein